MFKVLQQFKSDNKKDKEYKMLMHSADGSVEKKIYAQNLCEEQIGKFQVSANMYWHRWCIATASSFVSQQATQFFLPLSQMYVFI